MSSGLIQASDYDAVAWRALGLFSIYRLIVALLFTTLIVLMDLPEPLGVFNESLFIVASLGYLLAAIGFFIPLQLRWPRFPYQVAGQVYTDIAAITLIMYASAGVSSGFGILLVIAVAGGSLLKPGKIAYSFAALATLAVLGEELYSELVRLNPPPNYTHAAVLGIAFFIAVIVCHALARRVRESEELAASRAVDIRNLALLNEQIVQHMQSGVLVIDADSKIHLSNDSALKLLGTEHQELTGLDIQEVSPELARFVEEWRAQGERMPVIFKPPRAVVDVQVSFRSLTPGADASVLVLMEDASALRQRAQELKLASLGRMAASIAHEVRNPLGAISHAGQLLSESAQLDDDDRRLTSIIQEHSSRVNTIIENVMQVSRRESSVAQTFLMRDWLGDFAIDLCHRYELPAVAVIYQVEPDDIQVTMDQSQLHQILMNVCANALRYTRREPLLKLVCGVHADMDRPYLDIIDQGPGIPAEIAEQIFEPFVTSEHEGTGLGLYIARELCEANQAMLQLHANSDAGCVFRINFSLPDKQQVIGL